MKRLIFWLLVISVMLGTAGVALASDISDAIYYGVIRATNSSTLAENVSANVSINSTSLIAAGIMNSTANNTAIRKSGGTDAPFMPGYGDNPWIVWFDSVPENGSVDVTLYTNASNATIYWFPDDGGMTVEDDATLELDNYFDIELRGHIDTTAGAGKYFVDKTNYENTEGIRVYDSPTVNGTITADIMYFGTASSYVNENRNSSEKVYSGFVIRVGQRFNNFSGNITSVQFMLLKSNSPTGTGYARVRAVSDDSLIGTLGQIDVSTISGAAYTWYTFNAAAVFVEENQDIRVQFEYEGGDATNNINIGWQDTDVLTGCFTHYTATYTDFGTYDCTIRFYYTPFTILSISATGVSSGNMLMLSANATDFWIEIDGSTEDSTALSGGAVPDIGDNYTFCSGGCMTYVESVSVNVSGVEKGHWEWEYGTTFTDQSGNGNTATPTFRTTCSDADVSASLISFTPVELAEADEDVAEEWPEMMESPPDEPTTAYTEESHPGIFFEPLVDTLCTALNIPESFFWYNFAFIIIIGAGMVTFYFFAEKNTQALLIKIIVMAALMALFALPGPNIYGFYVVIYFAFWSFGVLVLSRSYGW